VIFSSSFEFDFFRVMSFLYFFCLVLKPSESKWIHRRIDFYGFLDFIILRYPHGIVVVRTSSSIFNFNFK
jgi:hypothetical protein